MNYTYKQKINSTKNNSKKLSPADIETHVKNSGEGFEVISENQPVRPYFDYDIYYFTEEEREKSFPVDLKRVIDELKTVYDLDKGKLIIFTSNGIDTDKQEAETNRETNLLNEKVKARPNKRTMARLEKPIPYYKNSINIIIAGCGYFKSNNDIIKPQDGTFDKNVYKSYQLIRLPFATKEGQNRFKSLFLADPKIEHNIDTFHDSGYKYEDLLITNTTGETEYNEINSNPNLNVEKSTFKKSKSTLKKSKVENFIEIDIDSEDSDDSDDSDQEEKTNVKTRIITFNTVNHFKQLLTCLKIERIENMNDWLLLMRISKNIIKIFKGDDFNKSKKIIHAFMEQTPDKYKFDEVENYLIKPDEAENETPATWGSLVKMAEEDNNKKYEKLFKKAGKIKKSDIFNIERLRALRLEPRRYYWSDYNKFNNTKFSDPTEILKYLIDSSFKIMNNGKPYYMTMNKTFKEFTKHGDIVFNYSFQTMSQIPFSSLKKCCMFKLHDEEFDLYNFASTFFQKFHFSNVQMLPYCGLIDPFKTINNENERILNCFDGFRMEKYTETKPGAYEKMLYHIKNVVCGDDNELYNYVIGWIASILQKPEIKHETCLLLQGVEGCGKNKFVEIVKRLLGENLTFDTHNIDDIVGGFNAQLSGKLLVIGDELIAFAGYKKSDFIKGMLTSPNISITKKGVDTISETSFQRYIFTTNNEETLRMTSNERRICVIAVLDTKKGDYVYFKGLTDEMNDYDNIKALYDYLNNYDLSNFDFRKAPMTKLKQDTINNQHDGIFNWFIDYAETINISQRQKEIMLLATEGHDLFKIYINKFIRRKDFNNKMMNLLKCQYVKKTTGRYFIFNIAGMNALFKDLYKNDINIITVSTPSLANIRPVYRTNNINTDKLININNDMFDTDEDD